MIKNKIRKGKMKYYGYAGCCCFMDAIVMSDRQIFSWSLFTNTTKRETSFKNKRKLYVTIASLPNLMSLRVDHQLVQLKLGTK